MTSVAVKYIHPEFDALSGGRLIIRTICVKIYPHAPRDNVALPDKIFIRALWWMRMCYRDNLQVGYG